MPATKNNSMKWIKIDLAGLAACIGITAAAYMMVFQPLAEAQAQREAQQAELAARDEKANKLNATINNLRHDLAKLQKAATENPIVLQSAQHSNQRLADLTHWAADYKLEVSEVRTDAVVSTSRYDIVPIHLSGSGTFQSCTAFLHQLRIQFPDTGISGADLSDNPADPSAKTMFRFDLTWYAATSAPSAAK